MNYFRRAVALFLPAAMVAVVAVGFAYVAVQQVQRADANDPQIQLAEDAANLLDAGAAPASVVGTTSVDVARSLAPFVAIYDADGRVVASDGVLAGRAPVPPIGVLASARASGRDMVTWQPEPGVRIATVVIPWSGGTVLAGRSLSLVEQRDGAILLLAAAALISLLVAIGLMSLVAAAIWPTGPADPAPVSAAASSLPRETAAGGDPA